MSVYRELAGELQATRAHTNVLKSKNQQLQQHNLELRQEIEALVAAADRVRALAERSGRESSQPVVSLPMPQLSLKREAAPTPPENPAATPPPATAIGSAVRSVGLGSWIVLAATVGSVVLFSGLGFVAARFLISPPSQQQQR